MYRSHGVIQVEAVMLAMNWLYGKFVQNRSFVNGLVNPRHPTSFHDYPNLSNPDTKSHPSIQSTMWKWAQGAYLPNCIQNNWHFRIASVAGTAEPIYGPEAFQSVLARTKDQNPVSEPTAEDYEWTLPEQSHVETSTFYITAETGHAVMCQIIHSKVKYVTLLFSILIAVRSMSLHSLLVGSGILPRRAIRLGHQQI